LKNPPSLTPAAAFAEAEAFFQTFRPRYIDPEELEPKRKKIDIKTNRLMLLGVSGASLVLVVILGAQLYPRLRAKPAVAKQPVVSQAAPPTVTTQPPAAAQKAVSAAATPPVATIAKPIAGAAPPTVTATVAEAPAQPHVQPEMMNRQLTAPTLIPSDIRSAPAKEAPPSGIGMASAEGLGGGNVGNVFNSQGRPKVKVEAPKVVNVSAGVAIGLLVQKTAPIYPPIAKTARVQGTVVLQATISKTGAIEGLHVVSGPEMLRQSALDAVRSWHYRPYLLNNEPVAVETTVNVVFALGG
jgi:protein TonB